MEKSLTHESTLFAGIGMQGTMTVTVMRANLASLSPASSMRTSPALTPRVLASRVPSEEATDVAHVRCPPSSR
jgi:hypothetical protein